jgi:hypothetical protein
VTHKFAQVLFLAACCAGISTLPLSATPTCVDGAALSTYEALGSGGCTIGNLLFSNFLDTEGATGGATQLAATGITVDTIGPSGESITGPNDGVEFTAAWIATQGQTVDSDIFFTVSVVGGGPATLTDAGLAQLSQVQSTGTASVAEDGCTGVGCNPLTAQWGLLTLNTATLTETTADTLYSATGSVNVAKDIAVTGGSSPSGFAHLSLVQDTFSQVPEPRALALLLGLGLLAGGVFRKKFQAARS